MWSKIVFMYCCVFVISQAENKIEDVNNETEGGLTNDSLLKAAKEVTNPVLKINVSHIFETTAKMKQSCRSKRRKQILLRRVKTTQKVETVIVRLSSAITLQELLKTYPTRK